MTESRFPDDSEPTPTDPTGRNDPDDTIKEQDTVSEHDTVTENALRQGTSAGDPNSDPFGAPTPERFKLNKLIGEGGAARVHEAEDTRLGRKVAVKTLKAELSGDADSRERFVREARVLAGLAHQGLVPIYDAGVGANKRPYYAMERVEGRTLTEAIRSRSDEEVRSRHHILGLVDTFQRICQTVAFAHSRNVIHRDLKPGNIMVDRFGAVFVMDWGLAKRIPTAEQPFAESMTRHGAVLGTPGYMSPEQSRGMTDSADFHSDVFGLGVILYEILTGRLPFEGRSLHALREEVLYHDPEPPVSVNARVGRELSAICMKALQKDPRLRYADAGELADDIRRFREFRSVSAIRPRAVDRIGNWIQRNRVLASVLATLLFAAVAVGGFFGARAYFSQRILERGMESVQAVRQELDEVESRMRELRPLVEGAVDPDERRRLKRELEQIEAQWATKQMQLRGRLAAIIGFSFPSPDPRALEMARSQALHISEVMIETEDYSFAAAYIRANLEQFASGNLLRFSEDDVARLHDLLADAEAAFEPAR